MLGIVEVDTASLDVHPLATPRIPREKLAQMQPLNSGVFLSKRAPGRLKGCRVARHRHRLTRLRFGAFFHSENPPIKALLLLPARQPGGRRLSNATLPPPITTSSGSSAALISPTTRLTYLRHFFLPNRSRPRRPR